MKEETCENCCNGVLGVPAEEDCEKCIKNLKFKDFWYSKEKFEKELSK